MQIQKEYMFSRSKHACGIQLEYLDYYYDVFVKELSWEVKELDL